MTFRRFITIDRAKYRLYSVGYADTIYLAGPGLPTSVPLPDGVGLESPALREEIMKTIAIQKECSRKAREFIASIMEMEG